MDLLQSLTPYLEPHEAQLQTVYMVASSILATVMVSASIIAFIAPSTLANNAGLPLFQPSYSEKNKAVWGELQAAAHSTRGWILLFACREFTIGAAILLCNRFGYHQALSLLVQIAYFCGVTDSYATWTYGVKGGYKLHFFPTVAAFWIGPLGLWLYWR